MPLASLDAVHAVRQVWFAPAGARIRPVASATGQSRPGGATRPCRRLGAAASTVATAMDRNTVATSWM
jgi:hypothetical protein